MILPILPTTPNLRRRKAILLSDTADEIHRKVNLMYTDPNHLKVEDPGTVEGNVVFKFLDFFDTNKSDLEELKSHYRRGGLGDGVLKKRLIEILDTLISPMRDQRNKYASDLSYVRHVLRDGTLEARNIVVKKVEMAKEAMLINY